MTIGTDGVPDEEGVPAQIKLFASIAYGLCKSIILDDIAEKPQYSPLDQLMTSRNAAAAGHPISPLAASGSKNDGFLPSYFESFPTKKNFGERLANSFKNGTD